LTMRRVSDKYFIYQITWSKPRHTLLTYATLFRSVVLLSRQGCGMCERAAQQLEELAAELGFEFTVTDVDAAAAAGDPALRAEFGDRKSTRLNSSHVKSSYAVFCLKKKCTHTGACA